MTSVSSIFAHHEQPKDKQLAQLFRKDAFKKFQNLKQDPTPLPIVSLKLKPEAIQEEEENLESTIFVGNVPLGLKQKDVKKHFSQFGQIDKVWFRSLPVQGNKMGIKASHILKKYVEGAESMNAYVKFTNLKSAEEACSLNGTKLGGLTLRVSLCTVKELDYKTTIFVGNLPLNITEEELRNHFNTIGKIDNVRVIKNKYTSLGIGIGYVKFAEKQQMQKAITTMNGSELKGRSLRVKRAIEKSRMEKKVRKIINKKRGKGLINSEPSKTIDNIQNETQTPVQLSKTQSAKMQSITKATKTAQAARQMRVENTKNTNKRPQQPLSQHNQHKQKKLKTKLIRK